MSSTVIRVENLSKQYQIGAHSSANRTFREALQDGFTAPFRRAASLLRGQSSGASELNETFWALRDVNFEVQEGEVVGIIGRNGAGKSTLLKILSRITEPTEGRVTLHGRVGSLLEVGTGFHPELTGRENVFLNGAILGMSRREIERKFDEIIAFAEIERFVDTPVKHYSSGMYMRLAFAVAAFLEPEILIVDEVLAVGDAAFQKKCLGKMGDVAKEGRTVLFVSHNMSAVEALCQDVVLLEHGQIAAIGSTSSVIQSYLTTASNSLTLEKQWATFEEAADVGDEFARLKRVAVIPESDDRIVRMSTSLRVIIDFWNRADNANLHITLKFQTEDGIIAFSTSSHNDPEWSSTIAVGEYRVCCQVPANLLNSGTYNIHVYFMRDISQRVFQQNDVLAFAVEDDVNRRVGYHGKIPGAVYPLLEWRTERISEMSLSAL